MDILETAINTVVQSGETPRIHAGETERAVIRASLEELGFDGDDPLLLARVCDRIGYLTREQGGALRRGGRVLPGVSDILYKLSTCSPPITQTLVTGSCRASAEARLEIFGVGRGLELELGAYGEEALEKPELYRLSLSRIQHSLQLPNQPSGWVVGDSPSDSMGARTIGLKFLLVRTGRADCMSGMVEHNATVDDLSDTAFVFDLLRS